MIDKKILAEVLAHAQSSMPLESCGVVVVKNRRKQYVPCRNIAPNNSQFMIHTEDYAAAADIGQIVMVVHSHPNTNPAPSEADLLGIERSLLPWLIVNPRTGEHSVTKPTGYEAPLIGRDFVHEVADCYTLIQDYYKHNFNISLPHFPRQYEWWLNGTDLYRDHYAEADFSLVSMDSLQEHDVLIMRMGSPKDNHGGVYIGGNKILHHVADQLSCQTVYGGFWRKATSMVLRHKDLM